MGAWSPEQIAARLRLMHPDDPRSAHQSRRRSMLLVTLNHVATLKVRLIEALRRPSAKRGMRRTTLAGSSYRPGKNVAASCIVPKTCERTPGSRPLGRRSDVKGLQSLSDRARLCERKNGRVRHFSASAGCVPPKRCSRRLLTRQSGNVCP